MRNKKNILIVGAGISGLVCALELLKKGYKVKIIEKENKIGGLAKSFNYNNIIFDIGPHRFFSNKKFIDKYIYSILNNNFIKIRRKSAVLFEKKYFKWPLNIFSIFNMSFENLLNIVKEIIFTKHNKEINNYEDFIKDRYGTILYNQFFKDYTEKFFNIRAEEISFLWGQESINRVFIVKKITNIFSIIKYFIKNTFIKEKFFIYPKFDGIQAFCDSLSKQIISLGGEIKLNINITSIEKTNNEIKSINYNNIKNDVNIIIWTAPITTLSYFLGIKTNLKYRNLIIFNIITKKFIKSKINSFQWCYFGDKKFILNRISKPNNFSKNNTYNNFDSLCIEVTCSKKDKIWQNPLMIQEDIINNLIYLNAIQSKKDVYKIFTEKIENVYPIYERNFQKDLHTVKSKIQKINNIYLAGRSGLFWYNNMDDSIENSLELSRQIYEKDKIN